MLSQYANPDIQAQNPPSGRDAELQKLRAQVERMQDRERRLMDLLNASAPEKIEHELRNVLNERVLLRALLDPSGKEEV